jgi:hypothetical protein
VNPTALIRSSVAILIATLLLGGCSSDGEDPEVEPLDVNALAQNTTAFQSDILADGEVAPDEYERAVLAAHTCVKDQGFSPEAPTWTRGELMFSVEMTAESDEALTEMNNRYDAAYEACMSENVNDVGRVWTNQLLLSNEERDAMRPDVINCLQAADLDVTDDASDSDIFDTLTLDTADAWEDCTKRYPEFFMVPSTGE